TRHTRRCWRGPTGPDSSGPRGSNGHGYLTRAGRPLAICGRDLEREIGVRIHEGCDPTGGGGMWAGEAASRRYWITLRPGKGNGLALGVGSSYGEDCEASFSYSCEPRCAATYNRGGIRRWGDIREAPSQG